MGLFDFLKKKSSQESYYGLSLIDGGQVKYEGNLGSVNGGGDYMPEVVSALRQRMPSLHIVVLPQAGLLIVVKENGEHSGNKFNSPMSVDTTTSFLANLLKEGANVKEHAQFGAWEIKFSRNATVENTTTSIQGFVEMLRKEFKEFVYSEEWESQHSEAIKKIGKSISENYGFPGMQQVYRGYAEPLPNGLGDIKASILSKIWNGISGWQW